MDHKCYPPPLSKLKICLASPIIHDPKPNKEVFATLGGHIEIHCIASGVPVPEIVWIKVLLISDATKSNEMFSNHFRMETCPTLSRNWGRNYPGTVLACVKIENYLWQRVPPCRNTAYKKSAQLGPFVQNRTFLSTKSSLLDLIQFSEKLFMQM